MAAMNSFKETYTGTRTKKMNSLLSSLTEEFQSMFTKEHFKQKLSLLKLSWNDSDKYSKLDELFIMFDLCGVKYKANMPYSYYEKLVESVIRDKALTGIEMEDRMIYALYSHYKECLSPEEYMRGIVDMMTPGSPWQNDTLRLRILKQFIKKGNYLLDAGYGGKPFLQRYVKNKVHITNKILTDDIVIDNIDDSIFDLLETASKEQRKPRGTYGILKLADDLAKGNFRTNDGTRRGLYLFAIVFDMTYYSGESEAMFYYNSDIERRLFRDYYANNFMRCISAQYRKNPADYEADPSGCGINYKNFEEMVYLYYISQDSNQFSPAEKISSACRMIKELKDAYEAQDKTREEQLLQDDATKSARMYASSGIFNKTESAFKEFILANYVCKKSGFVSEQKTALKNYCLLKDKLLQRLKEDDTSPEFCRYGLWFSPVLREDARQYINEFYERNSKNTDFIIDPEDFENFIEVLKRIDDYLTFSFEDIMDNKEPQKPVTRAAMIAVYYYLYNEKSWAELPENIGFNDFFKNFKTGIDHYLIDSYYQELNGKNIFDVLVAFSAYASLRL